MDAGGEATGSPVGPMAAGAAPELDEVVTVCVGGTMFATTVATLGAVSGSYLSTLFASGRWAPSTVCSRGGEQFPFVDRDPDSFKHVLAYLRAIRNGDGGLALPACPYQLRQLKVEAEFYGLPGLAAACGLGRLGAAVAATLDGGASPPPPPPQQQQQQQEGGGAADDPEPLRLPDSTLVAQCAVVAQRALAEQRRTWASPESPEHQQLAPLAALVLRHLLQLPLAARQPDLVAALAQPPAPGDSPQLLFALSYFPAGSVCLKVECFLVPSRRRREAAAEAAAAAVREGLSASASEGTRPLQLSETSGWGGATVKYYALTVAQPGRQGAERVDGPLMLYTAMTGEGHRREVAQDSFREDRARFSALHSLLVRQTPRSAVAGLLWLLQSAGFAGVSLSNAYVKHTDSPGLHGRFNDTVCCGPKSLLSFELGRD